MPISAELYAVLENHASELSKRIGRVITVDELANAMLEIVLKDKDAVKECVKRSKETKGRK